jgi:hypothetical protein
MKIFIYGDGLNFGEADKTTFQTFGRSEPANSPTCADAGHEHRPKARSVDHSSENHRKGDSKLLLSKSSASSSSLSLFPSTTPTTTESPYKTSEFYIIRVSIEGSGGPETEGWIILWGIYTIRQILAKIVFYDI